MGLLGAIKEGLQRMSGRADGEERTPSFSEFVRSAGLDEDSWWSELKTTNWVGKNNLAGLEFRELVSRDGKLQARVYSRESVERKYAELTHAIPVPSNVELERGAVPIPSPIDPKRGTGAGSRFKDSPVVEVEGLQEPAREQTSESVAIPAPWRNAR